MSDQPEDQPQTSDSDHKPATPVKRKLSTSPQKELPVADSQQNDKIANTTPVKKQNSSPAVAHVSPTSPTLRSKQGQSSDSLQAEQQETPVKNKSSSSELADQPESPVKKQTPTPKKDAKESTSKQSPTQKEVSRKRQKSPSPRRPVTKRQRRQVEKYESPLPAQDTPSTPSSVKLYDKSTTLAVRADGGTFYLCRTVNLVYNSHSRFKVRWFEVEQQPDLYRLAYEDRIELECVIGPAILQRTNRGLFRLTAPELQRINQLLNAAEKGADISKMDPALFKPQTEMVKAGTSYQNDDTDVEIEEPKKKRQRKQVEKSETPKRRASPRTPKESTGRKPRIPKSDTPKTSGSRGRGRGRGGGRGGLKRTVSIATAAPPMRRITTMPLRPGLQRKSTILSRPSLLRIMSLQRWPSLKIKGKKPKRRPGEPRPRLDPNRKLKQNPRVTVWAKDPLFESRETVPFVSTTMHSRLAVRAALLNDVALMESVIKDHDKIHSMDIQKSLHSTINATKLAIKHENHDMLKLLAEEQRQPKCRASEPCCLLETMGTGRYNPRTLPGVKAVRKIQVSRGGKEGNNALLKDVSRTYTPSDEEYAVYALQNNVSEPTIKLLCAIGLLSEQDVFSNIHEAIRAGHRKLAAKLMENAELTGGFGFNFMHKESLKFDEEEFTGKMLEVSVRKKPGANKSVGPLHCAAINPNTKYLSQLLGVLPEINITDGDKRRLIHYAAAGEGTGPLEMLINKGASIDEGDDKGWTPLIIACIAGRPQNVRILLQKLVDQEKERNEGIDPPPKPSKFGPGGINRPMKNSWCPIHFAVANQHLDVVKVLVEFGADVNKNLNANFNRITPLIMAAQDGNLDLVKFLITKQAVIEKPDKLKRTALTHAIRDGNAMVASYLLNLGVNPNVTDTSGNTALHYAAAYGWYFCMKILLDAGAEPDPSNDWKLTPMGVAYLKGHHGLTKILMDLPGVDINFQDEHGRTLLHQTLKKRPIKKETFEELRMLVEEKKANVSLLDKEGKSLFTYLMENELLLPDTWQRLDQTKPYEEGLQEAKDTSIAIADFLLEKGCNPWHEYGDHQSNFIQFIQQRRLSGTMQNKVLLYHLLDKRPHLDDLKNSDKTGQTLLHWICKKCEVDETEEVCKKLVELKLENGTTGLQVLRKMAKVREKDGGETALAIIAGSYSNCYKYWQETDEAFNKRLEKHRTLIQYFIEELQSEVEYVYEQTIEKDKTKKYHWTLLSPMLSIAKQDKEKGFKMVLKYKPSIDFRLSSGRTLLMEMICAGESGNTRLLMDTGADVNLKSQAKADEKMTPALLAISHRNAGFMREILERGGNVHDVREDTGSTLMHIAVLVLAKEDALKTVKILMEKGLDINIKDKKLRTVLHLAANRSTSSADESLELEQGLLKLGADPFMKDIRGRLPIHYLFVKMGDHRNSSPTDPVEPYSVFIMAMKNQHVDDPDYYGQTPLHRAAYRGATVCSMLLMQKGANINAKDRVGNTPFSLAVWKRHDSCALMMMQKGGDINSDIITRPFIEKKTTNGEEKAQNGPINALESSSDSSDSSSDESEEKRTRTIRQNIRNIKEKPVWKLLKRHFPVKPRPEKHDFPIFQGLVINGWQGLTFLAMDLLEPFGMQYAAAVEIAIVLQKFRFALNLMGKQLDDTKLRVLNERKQSLLHVLAATTSSSKIDLQKSIARQLVEERKVEVNALDQDNFTALHYAVLHKNWIFVNYILGCEGVDVNLKDKFNRTPIACLLWHPQDSSEEMACLHKLLRKGGNADQLIDYPPTSIIHGDYRPDVESTDYHQTYTNKKTTPLLNAIIHRCSIAVKTLVDGGASRNFADEEGVTPLMYAAKIPDSLYCELLITKCLDITQRSKEQSIHNHAVRNRDVPQPVQTDSNLFAGIKTFVKESDVDVNAVDLKGWSVLHHMVDAIPHATYEDVTILKLLNDAGAPLDQKNKDGLTPGDVALRKGGLTVVKAIQALRKVPDDNWALPTFKSLEVSDGIRWDTPPVDFQEDARAMLMKMEEEEAKAIEKEPLAVPDSRIGMSNCEVVMDSDIDLPYDILMTKVDVKVGEFGLYNFYKMQVVHETDKDLHLLFNCWGRIGDQGQYQRTPFKSEKEACEEFAKIFKAKSGNEWKNVKSFEVKPLKYRLVEADRRRQNKKPDVRFNLSSKIPSKLPPYVQDMISELSNLAMLTSTMRSTGISVPFGRLKREDLQKACTILQDLRDLAEKTQEIERNLTTQNLEDYRLVCQQVADLSSEYYYLVPQTSFTYERLPPLKNPRVVKKHIEKLADLLELQHAGSILLAAQYRTKEINPLDYIYRALGIRIQQLSTTDAEVENICRYVFADDWNSRTDIEAIYRVERDEEPDRLINCGLENHTMLWHGSRTSNLISILSRGLLIAPKDAPSSGSLFHKGIYSADSFAKSTGYCHNDGGGRSRFMLLCEVALGAVKSWDHPGWGTLADILPEGFNAVKGNGRNVPEAACRARLPTGAILPLGPHLENFEPYVDIPNDTFFRGQSRNLNYNEYIVYKEEQVCLRYIVQFR